jgi:hypothetical protein
MFSGVFHHFLHISCRLPYPSLSTAAYKGTVTQLILDEKECKVLAVVNHAMGGRREGYIVGELGFVRGGLQCEIHFLYVNPG